MDIKLFADLTFVYCSRNFYTVETSVNDLCSEIDRSGKINLATRWST